MSILYREIKIGALYLWLLVLYLLFSPVYFSIIYPGRLSGDAGILFIIIFFISFITLFISLPVLLVVKYRTQKRLLLGYVFLFFLLLSSLAGACILIDGGRYELFRSFVISNFTGLFISFALIGLFSKPFIESH